MSLVLIDKKSLGLKDFLWALLVAIGTLIGWKVYAQNMDYYEVLILLGVGLGTIWLGLYWKSFQTYAYFVAALSLASIGFYNLHDNVYAVKDTAFFLKYFLSSPAAIMWMSTLIILSTATYLFALFRNHDFTYKVSSFMTWTAAMFGFVGMMVRWYESYLVNADYGHIPVSTLYEVFVLFIVMTLLMYLYYEQKFKTRSMGGFVMLVMTTAVLFVLWYTFTRGANEIQPLIPALQSWWMKIHVPANFIGYGGFSIASMVGLAMLISLGLEKYRPENFLLNNLPSVKLMDDIMYRSIAIGFAFFTIATVLGAMWAAEAWGGYWSWDPKETWALIVWLNYAAWLHIRMSKGWHGAPMAWWAVIGLFITTFAFLGVNMFLSGLHSYGEL